MRGIEAFASNSKQTAAFVSPEGEVIIALPAFPAAPSARWGQAPNHRSAVNWNKNPSLKSGWHNVEDYCVTASSGFKDQIRWPFRRTRQLEMFGKFYEDQQTWVFSSSLRKIVFKTVFSVDLVSKVTCCTAFSCLSRWICWRTDLWSPHRHYHLCFQARTCVDEGL